MNQRIVRRDGDRRGMAAVLDEKNIRLMGGYGSELSIFTREDETV
jgi:hypothetical protein